MNETPDNHELARQFAVLEERMNTIQADFDKKQAEYRTDIARLAAHMAERDANLVDKIAGARWWQTAILSGVIAAVGGIVTAIILAAT